MDNNWQRVSLLEAKYLTQGGKFKTETDVDPFAMEERKFIHKENEKIRFKFKMVMSDPVKYYVCPTVNGEGVTVEEFKEAAGIAEI